MTDCLWRQGWDGHPEPLSLAAALPHHSAGAHSEHAGHSYGNHSHGMAALPLLTVAGHCNPGGDPTATVNGRWKDPSGGIFTIDPPSNGAFTASGPGWNGSPHGRVFSNGSFWLELSPTLTSTGVFTNTSSWEKLCWWTAITWIVPPPGASASDHWCKVGAAGCTAPPGPPPPPPGPPGVPGGRNVDGPFGLRGSVAGAFMMGSGGATRWSDLPELRSKLEAVVSNISSLQGEDGFAMAFLRNETNSHENPNYVQSWVTHGLLEAAAGGVNSALSVLRKHFDWFNYETDVLARMLPPLTAPPHEQPACSTHQRFEGHCVYLIYQGMIHNTRIASSEVGTARDIEVVQDLYEEAWWLEGLTTRNTSMIWQREAAHNYEITAFEGTSTRNLP